jgi:hypothetical protein
MAKTDKPASNDPAPAAPHPKDVLDPFETAYREFGEALNRITGDMATAYGEAHREYLTEFHGAGTDPGKQMEMYNRFIEKVGHAWDKARADTQDAFQGHLKAVHTRWAETDASHLSPEISATIAANIHNAGYLARAHEHNLWTTLTYSAGGSPW